MPRNNTNVTGRAAKHGVGRLARPMFALVSISIAAGLWTLHARATPVVCSSGYQDNTCLTPIRHDPIPAPQCAQGPGWVTTGSPVWQGSHWSQPQCSYQAPPSCPAGMQQTAAPTWTGSQWTQPGCQAVPPPVVNPIAGCAQAIAQRQSAYGISDANAATDPPVLEANNTMRWHYWTANNYSDWKITWNGVYAPAKQSGNLFSFTTNGHFVVVKGARLDYGYDPGSGMEQQNFVAAVCEADPNTGTVIGVSETIGAARCGGKAPENSSGPCGR
ncbi:hypothetical protein [Burkholderia cenocepacia]|uniref:hypothetical protein n=1 Tax=Burkholderia cenocepacia TaxID=95486 RepID=UPI00396AF916